MLSSNYTNRLFGRTRGRSKKKINLKNYYETVEKFKLQNFNEKFDYGNHNFFCSHGINDKVIPIEIGSGFASAIAAIHFFPKLYHFFITKEIISEGAREGGLKF